MTFRKFMMMAATFALLAPAPANAGAQGVPAAAKRVAPAGPEYPSCTDLENRMIRARNASSKASDTESNARIASTGAGIAQTAGSHLFGASLGGPLGILGAAVSIVAAGGTERKARREEQQANMRYAALMGTYSGRGCVPSEKFAALMASTETAAGDNAPLPPATPRKKRTFNE